jgi:hypothetical protein
MTRLLADIFSLVLGQLASLVGSLHPEPVSYSRCWTATKAKPSGTGVASRRGRRPARGAVRSAMDGGKSHRRLVARRGQRMPSTTRIRLGTSLDDLGRLHPVRRVCPWCSWSYCGGCGGIEWQAVVGSPGRCSRDRSPLEKCPRQPSAKRATAPECIRSERVTDLGPGRAESPPFVSCLWWSEAAARGGRSPAWMPAKPAKDGRASRCWI